MQAMIDIHGYKRIEKYLHETQTKHMQRVEEQFRPYSDVTFDRCRNGIRMMSSYASLLTAAEYAAVFLTLLNLDGVVGNTFSQDFPNEPTAPAVDLMCRITRVGNKEALIANSKADQEVVDMALGILSNCDGLAAGPYGVSLATRVVQDIDRSWMFHTDWAESHEQCLKLTYIKAGLTEKQFISDRLLFYTTLPDNFKYKNTVKRMLNKYMIKTKAGV